MKIGPKFKIARRLGAPIFDKTQTQKFKASSEKKSRGRMRPGTNFAIQLVEKQKARFTYGITERQFSKYAKNIIDKKAPNPHERLFEDLESRLDNFVYRIGLGNTRGFARQLVSHGHIMVNGRKIDVPSYKVKKGDEIAIRDGSRRKPVFSDLEEKLKGRALPLWIARGDAKEKGDAFKWSAVGVPAYQPSDLLFDLNAVIQFYKR